MPLTHPCFAVLFEMRLLLTISPEIVNLTLLTRSLHLFVLDGVWNRNTGVEQTLTKLLV
jgi:hypothetical protein